MGIKGWVNNMQLGNGEKTSNRSQIQLTIFVKSSVFTYVLQFYIIFFRRIFCGQQVPLGQILTLIYVYFTIHSWLNYV